MRRYMRTNPHRMAQANPRFGYHQTHTRAAINTKLEPYFEDEDSGILDPTVLDADIMQSPEDAHIHASAFANNGGVLSPAESQAWEHHYRGGFSVEPASAGGPRVYHEDYNGPTLRNATHVPAFGHPPQGWMFEQSSGDCTPTGSIDFIPPPPPASFEPSHYHYHRVDSARGSFDHPSRPTPLDSRFNVPHLETGFISAPQVQTPMSPHNNPDWMSMAQQDVESRPMLKRIRGHSPAKTSVDLQRRDGIRKKNGRIEIPEERDIEKIEQMIETETDEDQLRELKQQKRLLRNREAALASRQRKKKHTDVLEQKEKESTAQINILSNQLRDLEIDRQHHERSSQILVHQNQELQRVIQTMEDEKRDMMMKHTEETASLRKKIQVLTEQFETGAAPPMSAEPSSSGLTDFNAEIEALNLGPHDWDSIILANDLQMDGHDEFTFEPKSLPVRPSPMLERKSSSSTITPNSSKKPSDGAAEQPIASGLLFFLLLCGAFVASKSDRSQHPGLPQLPPDVRAAAPTVLSNLLESGAPSLTNPRPLQAAGSGPAPSSFPHTNTRSRSRLDHMHDRLTTPTKRQEIDAAFSLTTAQYASISNMDFGGYDEGSSNVQQDSPPARRNLAEALASMQKEHRRNSKSEVYTRSLLWEQAPDDVIKRFKEMVRDHAEIEALQQRQNHDDMPYLKTEP